MAKAVFLDFEKDLGDIAAKIEKLETEELDSGKSNRNEIAKLEKLKNRRTAEIYRDLTPWQTAQVARHPNRPYTLDYIDAIFEDFHELHGDRTFADDQSIVGGLARLAEHAVMVIGHQKGRDTRERTRRNFGMTKPEGYRKALRLMKLAEKFNLPVFTFVDTPGAYPGIDAEERNQSEAIGRNIYELTKLRVPVISTIIGEGGSGGALAIAVADAVFMLQYSTYSVISPEGCASILWKNSAKAPEAAQALGLTAESLKKLGLVDKVISEPIGGAHSDPKLMASTLRKALVDQLKIVQSLTIDELLERRISRLLSYGRFEAEGPHAAVRIASLFSDDEDKGDQGPAEAAETEAAAKPAPKGPAKRRRTAKKAAAVPSADESADAAAKAGKEKTEASVDETSDAVAQAPDEAPVAAKESAKPARRRTTAKTAEAKSADKETSQTKDDAQSQAKPASKTTARKSAAKSTSAKSKATSKKTTARTASKSTVAQTEVQEAGKATDDNSPEQA